MANALAHVAVGVLAGARTTLALLTVVARVRSEPAGETRLVRLFQSDRFLALVRAGTAVELVLDTMPFVGARTSPGAQPRMHPLFAALAEDVVLLAASRLLRRS